MLVLLGPEHKELARTVGEGREACSDGYTPPDSGEDSLQNNIRGAMAEIAVCLGAGVDPEAHVEVYEKRPGASPDLKMGRYKVSVKSCKGWVKNPNLIVMEKDTQNDLYVLVRVEDETALCEILGYVSRPQLLTYEPEEWKWDNARPGAKKAKKRRRYVPIKDLKPFKGKS